jgi:polyhydroxyalkanoate synthase
MDDYLQLGMFDTLAAVQTIFPNRKINAVGYCLGGRLLAIAAACLTDPQGGPLDVALGLSGHKTDDRDISVAALKRLDLVAHRA